MSKMREVFEKWWDAFAAQHGLDLTMDEDAWGRPIYKHSHVAAIYDGAFAGYQAAIAAVKEGAKDCGWCKGFGHWARFDGAIVPCSQCENGKLYKLPDDLT